MSKEDISISRCIQCGKFAVTESPPLCVEHWLMYQQARHIELTWKATYKNYTASELEAASGYIVPMAKIEIPNIPFIGKNYNLNFINIDKGHINIKARTIQSIDVTIGQIVNQGDSKLANEIKLLTEAINSSTEINREKQDDVAEQLAFLAAQVTMDIENRSKGVMKSLINGIKDTLSTSAALLTIWNNVEPLLRAYIGS